MFSPTPLRLLVFLFTVSSSIAAPKPIIVATYNLENYLGILPAAEGDKVHTKPKTEASIIAVIAVIKEIQPDVDLTFFPGSTENRINIPIGLSFFWPDL